MRLEYDPERDLYKVLEVAHDATTDGIKIAHRRLIKKYHPDVGGDEDRASALNYARDVLVDPVQRRSYDERRSAHLHRPTTSSTTPIVPSPVTAPRAPGVMTEFLTDDIKDAFRSRDWFSFITLGVVGHTLDKVVHDATASDPIARSALDALAEWMRAERIKRDARARLLDRDADRVQRLNERLDAARAAARKRAR